MGEDIFEIDIDEGVALCTMKGPKMNAMSREMLTLLVEGMRSVLEDDEVKVIVLRGGSGHFSTGADLSIMGDKMDPAFLWENMRTVGSTMRDLHEGDKPFITVVDGWAVGGGFSLAICSDMTFATERALFLMSFVRISIIPDLGCSYFLSRRVGLAKAKELAFTGEVINAEEARQIGLVNRVVEHDTIDDEVLKMARRMARRSAVALAITKRNLNVANRLDLTTMLDYEASVQPFMVMSPEHQRDVKKFLEKTKDL